MVIHHMLYRFQMRIRDYLISKNNPFALVNFSPQHKYLLNQFPVDLIIHVGADTGQESYFYELIGAKKVYWIEPDPRTFPKLKRRLLAHSKSDQTAINALISSESNKELKLNLYTLSGANSIYEIKEIRKNKSRPTGKSVTFRTSTLSDVIRDKRINLNSFARNLLVIDVQGHELHVLKGISHQDLMQFQFLMCEVSKIEIYKGATTFSEVKNYLLNKGFEIAFEGERRAYDDVVFKNNINM